MDDVDKDANTRRDVLSDFRAEAEKVIPEHPFRVGEVARELVRHLMETDEDLLYAWLVERRELIVSAYLSDMLRSRPQRPSREARARSAFAEAAEQFGQDGDAQAFRTRVESPYTRFLVVNNSNLRKQARDMTAAEHRYVASTYRHSARVDQMLDAFHRAVAKRVGPKSVVSDVMDEETYVRLHDSITGGHSAPA